MPNPLLNTQVGHDSAIESLLAKGRELVAAFRAWKEDGCPLDPEGLRPIESLANKISRQARELQAQDTLTGAPRSEQHGDELIPFVLDLITETQPGSSDKGGLLVYLPDGKTKEWLPKVKIEYNILKEPRRGEDGRVSERGQVECQVPRWLARKREMI